MTLKTLEPEHHDRRQPPPSELLILGATGATGQHVADRALARGNRVRILVRDPARVQPRESVTVITGDATDPSAVSAALRGVDAVISALGRGLNTAPTTLIQDSTRAIVSAMEHADTDRVVFLSSFGVGESRHAASWLSRLYRGPAKNVYADKAAGEAILRASALDWTLLYPVNLTDGPATGRIEKVDLEDLSKMRGLVPRISRADVADVLVESALTDGWSRRTVVLSSPHR